MFTFTSAIQNSQNHTDVLERDDERANQKARAGSSLLKGTMGAFGKAKSNKIDVEVASNHDDFGYG